MTRNIIKISAAAALLLAAAGTMKGQSVDFLNDFDGARQAAMGGTAMGMDAAGGTIMTNPAAMALSDSKFDASINYMGINPTGNLSNQIGATFFTRFGNGLAVSVFGKGNLMPATLSTGEGGTIMDEFNPTEFVAGAGIAYRIIEGLSIGVNLKAVGSSLIPQSMQAADPNLQDALAFSGDISVMYRIKGFNIAVGATNFGTKIKYDKTAPGHDLPSAVRAGAGYTGVFGKHSVSASADVSYLVFNKEAGAGIGVEYGFGDFIFARGGFSYAMPGADSRNISGRGTAATVGIGGKFLGFTLDAAYIIPAGDTTLDGTSPMSNTFMVSLGWSF